MGEKYHAPIPLGQFFVRLVKSQPLVDPLLLVAYHFVCD